MNVGHSTGFCKGFLTKFISIYQSMPCLWKVKCKDYSDRNRKGEGCEIWAAKLNAVEPLADRNAAVKRILQVAKNHNFVTNLLCGEMALLKHSSRGGSGHPIAVPSILWYSFPRCTKKVVLIQCPIRLERSCGRGAAVRCSKTTSNMSCTGTNEKSFHII
jgi:hypothetical protein